MMNKCRNRSAFSQINADSVICGPHDDLCVWKSGDAQPDQPKRSKSADLSDISANMLTGKNTGKIFVVLALLFILAACGTSPKASVPRPKNPPKVELLIAPPVLETKTPIPTATGWISPMSATAKAAVEAKFPNGFDSIVPPLNVTIDGVSYGDYGREIVTNAGTIDELRYIGYFLPPGAYNAKTNREFQDQINVLSPETIWEGGYEYPADGDAYIVKPGEMITISVPSGWYVKVVPPSSITIYR